jgi:hypothetical protein
VNDEPAVHHDAAARHEQAAANHDRAAQYWEGQGDRARANLQRDLAAYERRGAVLERRWAKLAEPGNPATTRRTTETMLGRARNGARELAAKLAHAADALEVSAQLADEHARRRQGNGQEAEAAEERQTAERTREAARRARTEAERWLRASGEQES